MDPWPGNGCASSKRDERSMTTQSVCETDEFIVDESWLSAGP